MDDTTDTGSKPDPARWQGRAIMHVDMDAFFAAVEQLDHPEWRGVPVIVGGSPEGRGVVSTASYEARRYGIHSAMPAARAARLAPPETIWATPRFERYKELSDAVIAILRDVTPHVQPVSIDEAYLDITPGTAAYHDPVHMAEEIRGRVRMLGLTCSAGLSASKTVAKIASDHNKPDGLTVVRPGAEAAFLAPLPIRAMGGIGPKTAGRLNAFGIHTLGELAALDDRTAVQLLGSNGMSLVHRARGESLGTVHERDPVKSVSNERTFAQDVRDPVDVDRAVTSLAERVARRLRRKQLAGRTVHIKIRFSDFTTRTVQRTLNAATDDDAQIGPVARELVRTVWQPGVGVRLLGVGVTGLTEIAAQLDLFQSTQTEPGAAAAEERTRKLTEGLDAVRERFGERAIIRGSRTVTPRTTGTPATSYSVDDIEDADTD
jgi:DNA polymerase-4